MKLNKIYICGQSHSGKALLLELLDSHKMIKCTPYHNFGLSHLYYEFIKQLETNKYAHKIFINKSTNQDKYIIKIDGVKNDNLYVPIGELLQFLIKNNTCFREIFQAHFTKKSFMHVTSGQYDIQFSFNKYIKAIKTFFAKVNDKIFTIEEIDDILYRSYLMGIQDEFKFDLSNDYFALMGHNSITQIRNLFKHYDSFKIIVIKRDLLSSLFSFSLTRRLNEKYDPEDEKNIVFNLMLKKLPSFKLTVNSYFKKLESYLKYSDKIILINFDDIKNNPTSTMEYVYKFLNIKAINQTINSSLTGIRLNNLKEPKYSEYFDQKQLDSLKNHYYSKNYLNCSFIKRINPYSKIKKHIKFKGL